MSDDQGAYEQQEEALEELDEETPERDDDTELEGTDVRPGGDSTPQAPPR